MDTDQDIYVPAERQTPAERAALRHLTCAFDQSGIDAEARIVDAEAPHRSAEATTVEVRVSVGGDRSSDEPKARVVRVIWYDEITDERAYTSLALELREEARAGSER